MKSTIAHLQNEGFEDARLNVELLLSHALKCRRIDLYSHVDRRLTSAELDDFLALFERRLKHEPLQYIIGSTNFMGLTMKVDSRVLIPRPETETLVEQTMLVCNAMADETRITILDIGTGSGNVAISLAKFLRNVSVTAIDNDERALQVAKVNADSHGVTNRVDFLAIDALDDVDRVLKRRFDVLVSNPPYVPPDEWEHLRPEIRDFEPKSATTDYEDGLKFFRRISELAPYLLLDKGIVLLEVGDNQSCDVVALLEQAGFFDISTAKDLQGTERVVIARCRARSRTPTISP